MDAYNYRKPIVEACTVAGGVTKLAKLLGISHSAILQWDKVPPLRVLEIEVATENRITRYEMRPDLYGPRGVA